MKVSEMSPRDRRAIVLGVSILAPAFLFIWGVRPYLAALSDAREKVSVERDALSRERAAVTAAHRNPRLQHVADSSMQAATPRLFEGRDDVMASAELASYLGDVARKYHVWLQDASTRAATTAEGGVRTLHVDIRAESDLRGVLDFLQALENGGKLVRIDRLDISRQPSRSDENGAETLALSATIAAFAIPSESGVRTPDAPSGLRTAAGRSQ